MKSHVLKHSIKLDIVGHICNPNSWEMEAGKSEIKDYLWVFIEFKTNLDYVRHYRKEKKKYIHPNC